MEKEAKKILLAGVGATAMTYEKASEVINQWVEKGKTTVKDGKKLNEELKRNITEKGTEKKDAVIDKVDSLRPLTKEMLKEVLGEMNYATRADIVELKRKVETLETKIDKLENNKTEEEKK